MKGWHADHKIPYSIVKETNYDNMQATCASCNLKKGKNIMTMTNSDWESRKLSEELLKHSSMENARDGQVGMINRSLYNLKGGKKNTPLVGATGVGKTDVIRTVAIEAKDQGLCGGTIVVVPNIVLCNQLNNQFKINQWLERFKVKPKRKVKYSKVDKFSINMFENDEYWTVMTNAMFCLNSPEIIKFCSLFKSRNGLDVLLIADEVHLFSDQNKWGEALLSWQNAGSRTIQSTATSFRGDGAVIPGFEYIKIGETKKENHVPSSKDKNIMEVFETTQSLLELQSDYTYSFKRAWEDKVICLIERHFIDVEITLPNGSKAKISELAPSKTTNLLTKICRDPNVISECVKFFVGRLEKRRKNHPEISGIVFCGNDLSDSDNEDDHAKEIKSWIERYDSSLRVVLATNHIEEYKSNIEDFGLGKYDVLIVKQMGGVGLDIPTCKVELDLSSVRQAVSFVQKINRPSRRYKNILTCDYIAPADVLCQRLFDKFVTDQGGEMVKTDSTKTGEYEIEPTDIEKGGTTKVNKAWYDGCIGTDQTTSSHSEMNEFYEPMISMFPELIDALPSSRIIELAKKVGKDNLTMTKKVETIDVSKEREILRKTADQLAKKYAKMMVKMTSDDENKKKTYIDSYKEIYINAKRKSGIRLNRSMDYVLNIKDLENMIHYMEQFINEEFNNGTTSSSDVLIEDIGEDISEGAIYV